MKLEILNRETSNRYLSCHFRASQCYENKLLDQSKRTTYSRYYFMNTFFGKGLVLVNTKIIAEKFVCEGIIAYIDMFCQKVSEEKIRRHLLEVVTVKLYCIILEEKIF